MAITIDDPEALIAKLGRARREVAETLWRDSIPSPALGRAVLGLREVIDELTALRDREGRRP